MISCWSASFSVTGALYTCRPDLAGFVNGLPLVVIELKKPGVPARAAFDENLTHYKSQIPALFWYKRPAHRLERNREPCRPLTADWERFFEWKRVERETSRAGVAGGDDSRDVATGRGCSTCWRTSPCSRSTRPGW